MLRIRITLMRIRILLFPLMRIRILPCTFPIYEHLFEYIGTQFPPPSSLLYGKMGSITLFFFQMGILNMRQHFMHWILVGSSHYFTSNCNESEHICETLKGEDLFGQEKVETSLK